jgi:DNA processing protein
VGPDTRAMPAGARPRSDGVSSSPAATEREARWACGLLPQLGGVALQGFLEAFGSVAAAWSATPDALRQVAGIGPITADAMRRFPWRRMLREDQARVGDAGLTVIVWGDDEYPSRLRAIHSAPPVLYVRGTLEPEDEAAVAIVGSRRATAYGEEMAGELARELGRRGLTIVSGLARGIDAAAHRGALGVGARTVAVLGNGLDQTYPPEHRELAAEVAGSGALLSEFPLGTAPLRPHFPRRNRIISGLSLGVVVVEAGVESGALITANHALEQGRDVFAVPGRVHARYSEGCNRLIKAGAKLVESWEDVLAELVPNLKSRTRRHPAGPPPPDLADDEQRVYDLLADGPLHIDAIIVQSGLGGGRAASVLVGLEMKGVIRQLRGKVFERTDGG